MREILALAADYSPSEPDTQAFFQAVQNKLHFAATGRTAPELIAERDPRVSEGVKLTSVSGALKVPPPGFEELSVEEQIDYVQALWSVIAAKPDKVAVPEWHRAILDERLADAEREPDDGIPWEQYRTELLGEPAPKRR